VLQQVNATDTNIFRLGQQIATVEIFDEPLDEPMLSEMSVPAVLNSGECNSLLPIEISDEENDQENIAQK
jgi:hypothetical protein